MLKCTENRKGCQWLLPQVFYPIAPPQEHLVFPREYLILGRLGVNFGRRNVLERATGGAGFLNCLEMPGEIPSEHTAEFSFFLAPTGPRQNAQETSGCGAGAEPAPWPPRGAWGAWICSAAAGGYDAGFFLGLLRFHVFPPGFHVFLRGP